MFLGGPKTPSDMLANSRGQAILDQTVDSTNFRGPPLILHGDGLTATTDSRWVKVAAFADSMSAPLIGLNKPSGQTYESITSLLASLANPNYTRCFTPAQVNVPIYRSTSDGAASAVYLTGPIMSIPTGNGSEITYPVWQDAWTLSALLTRAPNGHPYGFGMSAIGNNVPGERPTPPVYLLTGHDSTMLEGSLARLLKLWRDGETPTQAAIESLLYLEAERPGLQRWINPIVHYWVMSESLA